MGLNIVNTISQTLGVALIRRLAGNHVFWLMFVLSAGDV